MEKHVESKTAGRTECVRAFLKLDLLLFQPPRVELCWDVSNGNKVFPIEYVTVSFGWHGVYFNEKLTNKNQYRTCLTNHQLQNIPLVSCCLHVIMFSLFFVNTCTFSAYLLHLLLKKDKTHTVLTDRCKDEMKYKLIFEIFYYEISCYNLPLFTFFVQNPWVCTAHDS